METPNGEGWFIHFQSYGAHGRIVHLEPVRWQDDWPIIGESTGDTATGQPVPSGPIPGHPASITQQRPQISDEFSSERLGPQWEWNHNPDDAHWSLSTRRGYLRLIPMQAENLQSARNTLTELMQDNSFEFTTRLDLKALRSGAHTGLAMFQKSASGLEIVQSGNVRRLDFFHLADRIAGQVLSQSGVQLRVRVDSDQGRFFFSLDDGQSFHQLGTAAPIRFSWWRVAAIAVQLYNGCH